ncbi:MAG: hypothetical protein AAGC43_08915 [Bacteroidota bacterium]
MKHKIKIPEGLTMEGLEIGLPKGKPFEVDTLERIIEFINTHFKPRGSISYYQNSLDLKCIVERCFDNEIRISNGELIAAMILCGYKYVRITPKSKNCHFNVCRISKKKERAITSQMALE